MTRQATLGSIQLAVDGNQCIGCAICADVCPSSAFIFERWDLAPQWLPSQCNGCRICARECPTQAITIHAPGRAYRHS